MSDKFDLSIAIVSWNVQELLRQTLESVYRETKGITFEIFVVDNASRDGSAEMVQRLFPRAWLFANTDNLGFAKANNRALREARGRYIVLLNPDTEIRDNALQKMVSWMDAHPRAGIAGPQLLNPDGSIQPSTRNFPTFSALGLTLLKLHHLWRPKIIKDYYQLDFDHAHEQEVDQVMGAALFIRRAVIEVIGLLDEGFWIWFEEADWCKRARNAGFEIWFTPAARIMHIKGESFKQQLSVTKQHWFNASLLRYAKKYLSPYTYPLLFMLAKLTVLLAGVVQLAEYVQPLHRKKEL